MVSRSGRHILSFDVENWFDGNLHQWEHPPARPDRRLPEEMSLLLDLLGQHGVRATFFVLGTVAEDHPEIVRRIAAAGHEVACHALTHDLVHSQAATQYLDRLRQCRALLQDLSGQPVVGHRAPSWSIDRRVPWATDVLLDAGFTYDSSIFPMRTPLYGEPTFPSTPYWLMGRAGRRLLELPPAVRRLGPLTLPYGGGFYWRALPLWLIRSLLAQAEGAQVTYLHPWELNASPIHLPEPVPLLARLVMRYGISRMQRRLDRLLHRFSFEPFASALPRWQEDPHLRAISLGGE